MEIFALIGICVVIDMTRSYLADKKLKKNKLKSEVNLNETENSNS